MQIDARAPFSRIAAVLGVSDQTVARRYARLRSTGALRVRGLTDPYLHDSAPWFLRLRCAPAAAAPIAKALARRDDTAWIRLTSGGAEVTGMVAGHGGTGETLLLDTLPRTSKVEGVTAHYLLHTFGRGLHRLIAAHSGLTGEQIRALRPAETTSDPHVVTIDDGDRALLRELAQDGRLGSAALAAATGRSSAAVRRRIPELIVSGAVYFDVEVDSRLFPATATWTLLWLSVAPAALETVGAALARHPEVGYAAATTGPTNIYAAVACANRPALYDYLTGQVARLSGIRHLETAPVQRNIKGN